MSNWTNNGRKTFTAGEALEAYRRVKLDTGSGISVVYADAGEVHIGVTLPGEGSYASGDSVPVQLANAPGTIKVEAAGAISAGATVYGAADGKISSSSSGSVIGQVRKATTADGDIVELYPNNAKPTTAGATSITDAGGYTAQTEVEAALQEIYLHLLGAQGFIPVPLSTLREATSNDIPAAAAHGGVLAKDTTPIFEFTNGDTDSALRLNWAASNSDAVVFQVPLPPDLDTASDLVIHFRGAMAGATDTPTIASDAYFNEGDTKVEDASSALGSSVAENTITIAAADIPSGAQTLTVELTPGAHTTDALYIYALWIEYSRVLLTA